MTVNFIWQSYLHLLCLPKNAHGSGELSEYEKKRLENIRQNSEFFDGLQLTEVMTLLLCHFAFAYTHIFIYIYIYIWSRKSASRFSRGTVLNTLKQSRINIMRGKNDATTYPDKPVSWIASLFRDLMEPWV